MSVTEIKEAVGRLSAEELAEVSAFIESREADWLERCGKTADERLEARWLYASCGRSSRA
ncbi:MAG: hypothetical protein EBZ05_08045 [Verrucomicrobia bacterium]|nr:hypothetical protein [Verrucomicrobiota bacterium]